MTSRDVNKLVKDGENGVSELYKTHMKYFNLVDEWAERLTNGDLLDEYEIAQGMERLTGCLMKLGTVAGALEALKEELEHNTEVKEYGKLEKVRAQDTAVVKAQARNSVSKIRKWATDFRNYFYSAQSGVVTCQSRLKRLTVEKAAKRVDRTGETPVEETKDTTGNPPQNLKDSDNTGKKSNEW
jgi:hypothetical protein